MRVGTCITFTVACHVAIYKYSTSLIDLELARKPRVSSFLDWSRHQKRYSITIARARRCQRHGHSASERRCLNSEGATKDGDKSVIRNDRSDYHLRLRWSKPTAVGLHAGNKRCAIVFGRRFTARSVLTKQCGVERCIPWTRCSLSNRALCV